LDKIIWIGLIIMGWSLMGSFILSMADRRLELYEWKIQAPELLIFIVNLLWPIVVLFYLTKKDK